MGVTAELCDKIVATNFDSLHARSDDQGTPPGAGRHRRRARRQPRGRDRHPRRALSRAWRRAAMPPRSASASAPSAPRRGAERRGDARAGLRADVEPRQPRAVHHAARRAGAGRSTRRSPAARSLTALVKGIEIQGWLREAPASSTPDALQFHPPGLVGPMGSAVAAGHVLGLDAAQLATRARHRRLARRQRVSQCRHDDQVDPLRPGGMLGLEAAMLAARGFTANPEPFEAHQGYVASILLRESFQPRGPAEFRPAVPHGAARLCDKNVPQPVRHAFRHHRRAGRCIRKIADPAAIRAVTPGHAADALRQPSAPGHRPVGQIQPAIHLRRALLRGNGQHRHFHRRRACTTPTSRHMLRKITMRMVPDIPARFDLMHVEAEVELADGRVAAHALRRPARHVGPAADQRRRSIW